MGAKKGIYLFLALLLPGVIFMFLKKFGKNEFDLPLYGAETADASCGFAYASPYVLPDSLWTEKKAALTLFTMATDTEEKDNLAQLAEDFSATDYQLMALDSADEQRVKCVLLLKQPWTTVLVDAKQQIRGYYKPGTREEFDRLKMEMNILLKHY